MIVTECLKQEFQRNFDRVHFTLDKMIKTFDSVLIIPWRISAFIRKQPLVGCDKL